MGNKAMIYDLPLLFKIILAVLVSALNDKKQKGIQKR